MLNAERENIDVTNDVYDFALFVKGNLSITICEAFKIFYILRDFIFLHLHRCVEASFL